jgi:hypothetical protein
VRVVESAPGGADSALVGSDRFGNLRGRRRPAELDEALVGRAPNAQLGGVHQTLMFCMYASVLSAGPPPGRVSPWA